MVRAKDIDIEKLRKIIIESNICQTDRGDVNIAPNENDEKDILMRMMTMMEQRMKKVLNTHLNVTLVNTKPSIKMD